MFSGLIEDVGRIAEVTRHGDAIRLTIESDVVLEGTRDGDSIAVNGVCLTAVDVTRRTFGADVMQESLDRSTLGDLIVGEAVNLERALRFGDRLGGHLVQGHVDATAHILERRPSEHWVTLRISAPAAIARYVVSKGSIAVNGTSLTVCEVGPDYFEVSLIPTTLAETTFGTAWPGDRCNLEADVLAKYTERLLGWSARSAPTEDTAPEPTD